jgi:hypothetical protein
VFLLQPGPDVNQALGPQVGVLPDAVLVPQAGHQLGCALSAVQLAHGALQGGVIVHGGEQNPGDIRADRVQLGGGGEETVAWGTGPDGELAGCRSVFSGNPVVKPVPDSYQTLKSPGRSF